MKQFPSKKEIRDFIETAQADSGTVSRREIARAFNIKGEARTELRRILAELNDEGAITKRGKKSSIASILPPVLIVDIVAIDEQGDLICAPSNWREESAPPAIIMSSKAASQSRPALGRGDRVLVKVKKQDAHTYLATPMKKIGQGQEQSLGVFHATKSGGTVQSVSLKSRRDYIIEAGDTISAKEGDLVWIEPLNSRGYGPKRARIREIVGNVEHASSYSLIAIANHDIRKEFPLDVLKEANKAELPAPSSQHLDLRQTPLITIDPADAQDHDDAVYASADTDPQNEGGWRIIVAIADVAYFVTPGSALDKEAVQRGNSTYLPDMVVPMLPERLSNYLCSLREGEDRPALAVEMVFSRNGTKKSHRFMRIMMRSHAGVSYEEVQSAIDGNVSEKTEPILETVLRPLWRAYATLKSARDKRGPLELELPERKIIFGDDGLVERVETKQRFDAHKLIEEFMIQANIAAAETLEEKKIARIYRVHPEPDDERMEDVGKFLDGLGYSLPKGQVLRSTNLNSILRQAEERDESALVGQVLLRAQKQAIYDIKNQGHFGLNLRRYTHFTSPIRRYADLTVHRALIAAHNFGLGAQDETEALKLEKIAGNISGLERKSMSAERESTDRFLASWLSERVGAQFSARINGVTRSGLFVTLEENGADGFIPARTIGDEYFYHDEQNNALISERSKKGYRLGQPVDVRLREAIPLKGGLQFEMLSGPQIIQGVQAKKTKTRRDSANKEDRPRKFKPRGKRKKPKNKT